jgi:pro-sigmaK processing inhibitor BofA
VLRIAAAAGTGAVIIGVVNLVGGYVGLFVPFNALSVLSAGFLGIPGLVLVIALHTLL